LKGFQKMGFLEYYGGHANGDWDCFGWILRNGRKEAKFAKVCGEAVDTTGVLD
jgi:hypothetical protein